MTDLQTMPEPTIAPTAPSTEFESSEQQTQYVMPELAAPTPAAPGVLFRVLGCSAAISGLSLAMVLEGTHPSDMLQITALLFVITMSMFGLIASHGPRMFGRLVAVACGSSARDDAEADCLRGMCHRGRRLCYSAGVLGMLVGAIHVMSVLDQPALIAPGLAVAMVNPVIAIVFAEIGFGAAAHWVRTKRD